MGDVLDGAIPAHLIFGAAVGRPQVDGFETAPIFGDVEGNTNKTSRGGFRGYGHACYIRLNYKISDRRIGKHREGRVDISCFRFRRNDESQGPAVPILSILSTDVLQR